MQCARVLGHLLDKLVGAKLTLGEEEAAPLPALELVRIMKLCFPLPLAGESAAGRSKSQASSVSTTTPLQVFFDTSRSIRSLLTPGFFSLDGNSCCPVGTGLCFGWVCGWGWEWGGNICIFIHTHKHIYTHTYTHTHTYTRVHTHTHTQKCPRRNLQETNCALSSHASLPPPLWPFARSLLTLVGLF